MFRVTSNQVFLQYQDHILIDSLASDLVNFSGCHSSILYRHVFLQKEFLVSHILHALTGLTIEIKTFWDASNQSFRELATFHELKLQNVSAYRTK